MIGAVLKFLGIVFSAFLGTKYSTIMIEKIGIYDYDWVDSDGDGDGKNDENYIDSAMDSAGKGLAMAGILIVGVLWYASRRS